MPNDSMRTVLVALGSGLAVAVAKAVVAVVTGSSAMAAEASHSLADTANDLFLFVAQRRGTQVKSLVRGIESGMKRESEAVYRVDIVPIGGASA
jgi:phage-related minor tail protein